LGKSSFTQRNQSASLLNVTPGCDFSARSMIVAGNSIFFSMYLDSVALTAMAS
jgi:uncharacterized membrane protein